MGCFDRFFDKNAPVEIGAIYPSQLSDELVKEAYKLTESAGRSLGLNWGPVKSDLVLTENGFQILEMAPRLHGPKGTLWLSTMSGGSNHLEVILGVITGEELMNTNLNKPTSIAMFTAIKPSRGVYNSILGIDKALEIEGVDDILVFSEGNIVIEDYNNSTDIPGYVFVSGNDMEEVKDVMIAVKKEIQFQ